MEGLLQLKINGIKNIENEITINFINTTIENGIKSVDKVKGIFGYNGAGKTAIMTAIDIYKNVTTDIDYLKQSDVKEELSKLINYRTKKLTVSVLYHLKEDILLRHFIVLACKETSDFYRVQKEEVSILSDRSINGNYKNILESENGTFKYVNNKFASSITDGLGAADLETSSIVPYTIKKLINEEEIHEENIGYSTVKKLLFQLFYYANNFFVYLKQSDRHRNYKIDKAQMSKILEELDFDKDEYLDNFIDVYNDEDIIPAILLNRYKEENKKLEKFIKYFKPELKKIELIERENKNLIHVRRLFKYKDYNVEYEFESSGIKQLVTLFNYLIKCANGATVFIDEMDTNLNSAYFSTLISFFVKYGKGQLIFTTHNLEVMNSLKEQKKSILILGVNNALDVWVGRGNRSPISDYLSGNLPNSPMNIENFDFINIFFGE